MSKALAKQITERLKQQVGQGGGAITVDGDGVSVSVDVEHSERYAVGVRGMSARPAQPRPDVGETADRIARGVTELDSPLQVVEYDRREGQAILRSAEPESDEAGVTYWEADVRADEASLQRYRKEHSEPDRQAVTEPLTHANAGRVAEQLADALRD